MPEPQSTQTTSGRTTVEQQRAASAWNNVAQVKPDLEVGKKYRSYVKSASTLILTNGLGQTLAFWNSKSGAEKVEQKAYSFLLKHLSEWVTTKMPATNNNLLDAVVQRYNSDTYRQATSEVLAYLVWLKRFADAELQEESRN